MFPLMAAFCLALTASAPAQEAVTTLAGTVLTSGAKDGPAVGALFGDPTGLAIDSGGDIYIADNANDTIRLLSAAGSVSTLAGRAGQFGTADGSGTNAFFNAPTGIVLAPNGLLYVTDTGNNTIRCVTSAGVVTTLVGPAGQYDAEGYGGEPGFLTRIPDTDGDSPQLNMPLGITADTSGTLYVADSGSHAIVKVTSAGETSVFAGTLDTWGTNDGIGIAAQFNGPVGVAFDNSGNLFVSDSANHTIRKITSSGSVSTWAGAPGVAGTNDGTGSIARFGKPAELRMDRNNNLYVVDSFYHTIRRISPGGVVTTVAGLGGSGGSANGVGGQARFLNPYGLAVDHNGNLRVSDTYNETIRFVYSEIAASLGPNPSGPGFLISWQAVPDDTYQVQFKNVAGGAWENLGAPVLATGSIGTQTDASASSQRLYRVKLMP